MSATTTEKSDTSETAPHCLVEKRGHVLIITMNRPERKNAITGDMMAIMVDAWDQVDNDPDIRVAVLTGAGGDFCAGADLKNMSAKPRETPLRAAVSTCPKSKVSSKADGSPSP